MLMHIQGVPPEVIARRRTLLHPDTSSPFIEQAEDDTENQGDAIENREEEETLEEKPAEEEVQQAETPAKEADSAPDGQFPDNSANEADEDFSITPTRLKDLPRSKLDLEPNLNHSKVTGEIGEVPRIHKPPSSAQITFPDDEPVTEELLKVKQNSEFTIKDKGQSVFQDNQAVDSHNLQSSEGQPQKPSSPGKGDAIATFTPSGTGLGNACGDDLLASQAEGNQLEHSLTEQAETVSSLKVPEILVSKSKTSTNHLIVKCDTPVTSFEARLKEMQEISHFLQLDGRFQRFTFEAAFQNPGRKTGF
jgi:hypothetical protein